MGEFEPTVGDMPGEVITAAHQIEAAIKRSSMQRRDDLLSAAAGCEAAFQGLAAEIRDQAWARLRLGAPPSLRRMVGGAVMTSEAMVEELTQSYEAGFAAYHKRELEGTSGIEIQAMYEAYLEAPVENEQK